MCVPGDSISGAASLIAFGMACIRIAEVIESLLRLYLKLIILRGKVELY